MTTAAETLIEIYPPTPGVSVGDGFCMRSGDDMMEMLLDAGWSLVWSEADYHWSMCHRDGSAITYVEGDLYLEDSRQNQ